MALPLLNANTRKYFEMFNVLVLKTKMQIYGDIFRCF